MIEQTNLEASELLHYIKLMKSEKKKYPNAEERIKENIFNILTQNFLNTMHDYNNIQTKFQTKMNQKIENMYKIGKEILFLLIKINLLLVNIDVSQQEIEKSLNSDNPNLFLEHIFDTEKKKNFAKEAVSYIEIRQNDIIKLERSIKELHNLFSEMKVLVEDQGK